MDTQQYTGYCLNTGSFKSGGNLNFFLESNDERAQAIRTFGYSQRQLILRGKFIEKLGLGLEAKAFNHS